MMQVIIKAAIRATKAAIMAVGVADNPDNNARPIHSMPRSGVPVLRQSTFDGKVADKYQDMFKLEMEVNNIFITNIYKTKDNERV